MTETDLQIEGVDIEVTDGETDDSLPVDMVELDLTLSELENTDSNEVVPSTAAPNEYGDIAIDVDHFPDANFRAYVLEKIDTNGDGYLSEAERLAVTILEIYNMKISDLDGVEYFSEMKKLNCSDNFLTELDVSHNLKLEDLDCEKNRIEQLDVSKNIYLEDLTCSDNNISELDVSGCKNLKALNCENNKLKKLDVT